MTEAYADLLAHWERMHKAYSRDETPVPLAPMRLGISPSFSVEVGEFRMIVRFEHIGKEEERNPASQPPCRSGLAETDAIGAR